MKTLDQIAGRAGDLPALPQVACRALRLIDDPGATAADLMETVSQDQALASRVLRLSNCAYYGVSGRVTTLSRAIFVLGLNTVRSVVLVGCTEFMYRPRTSAFGDRVLWEHSLGAAVLARFVADECGFAGVEEAFVSGLLHDIGKAVMDHSLGEDYRQVVRAVYNGEHPTFLEAEREAFGFDHTDVGGLVASHWGLPASLQEAVRHHHDPRAAERAGLLCAVTSLANALCVKLEVGPERRPDLDLAALPAWSMLGVEHDRVESLVAGAGARLDEAKEMLALDLAS